MSALLYGAFALVGESPNDPANPLQCAYFSVVTFTTLGLGDLEPFNNFARFLVALEAVVGAFLMAAFIVTLARR